MYNEIIMLQQTTLYSKYMNFSEDNLFSVFHFILLSYFNYRIKFAPN